MNLIKLTQIILFASCIAVFSSCGKSVDLAKAEDTSTLKEAINEHMRDDMKVESIIISCGSSSSVNTDVESAIITYINPEGKEMTMYIPFGLSPGEFSDKESLIQGSHIGKGPVKGRAIKDYDYSAIASNVAKAIEKASEKDIPVHGIDSYRIEFFEDPTLDKHHFSLLSKQEGSTTMKGRQIVTSYYEFDCTADAEGNVTVKGLDEVE
jgi:hypothetical protein